MVDPDEVRCYDEYYLDDFARVCNYYDNDLHPLEVDWRSHKFFFGGDVMVQPFLEDDGTLLAYVVDGRGERVVADVISYLDSMFGDV